MRVMTSVSSREQRYRTSLEAVAPGLADDLKRIVDLEAEKAERAISYLLGLACRAGHVGNIQLGRNALLAMPRSWLTERIEAIAARAIDERDEWEFLRLLELYDRLEAELVLRVALRGRVSSNPEIAEAAQDFLSVRATGSPRARAPWGLAQRRRGRKGL